MQPNTLAGQAVTWALRLRELSQLLFSTVMDINHIAQQMEEENKSVGVRV